MGVRCEGKNGQRLVSGQDGTAGRIQRISSQDGIAGRLLLCSVSVETQDWQVEVHNAAYQSRLQPWQSIRAHLGEI
jgi:hypothetical protein